MAGEDLFEGAIERDLEEKMEWGEVKFLTSEGDGKEGEKVAKPVTKPAAEKDPTGPPSNPDLMEDPKATARDARLIQVLGGVRDAATEGDMEAVKEGLREYAKVLKYTPNPAKTVLSHHAAVIAYVREQMELEKEIEPDEAEVALEAPIVKRGTEESRMVYGFANVSHDAAGKHYDSQGDHISTSELRSAWRHFTRTGALGGVNHIRKNGGTITEGLIIDDEVAEALMEELQKGHRGLFVGYHATEDRAWAGAKSGELKAFSIAGKGRRKRVG